MNALPWQDQVLIALAAFAVVGALGLVIWCLIGTIEEQPRPGQDARVIDGAAGPGHADVWTRPWAEPSEEDTLTWLARVHEDVSRPGSECRAEATGATPAPGPGHPDRLGQLAAAFAADTIIDARIRDWLDELIEKGLDGYRTADEWVAARTRELSTT